MEYEAVTGVNVSDVAADAVNAYDADVAKATVPIIFAAVRLISWEPSPVNVPVCVPVNDAVIADADTNPNDTSRFPVTGVTDAEILLDRRDAVYARVANEDVKAYDDETTFIN